MCGFCDQCIEEHQSVVMIQGTECFHSVHHDCFKTRAKKCLMEDIVMTCPECHKVIPEEEMKNYMSAEERQEIEKSQLDKVLAASGNMARCSCGNVMEFSQGQVDYNAKDDTGQVMSPAAAIHMSKFRIRCQACENNFCHGCSIQPYHAGKNCEEYHRHLNSKKCRFCGNELANQEEQKGAAAADDDICLR